MNKRIIFGSVVFLFVVVAMFFASGPLSLTYSPGTWGWSSLSASVDSQLISSEDNDILVKVNFDPKDGISGYAWYFTWIFLDDKIVYEASARHENSQEINLAIPVIIPKDALKAEIKVVQGVGGWYSRSCGRTWSRTIGNLPYYGSYLCEETQVLFETASDAVIQGWCGMVPLSGGSNAGKVYCSSNSLNLLGYDYSNQFGDKFWRQETTIDILRNVPRCVEDVDIECADGVTITVMKCVKGEYERTNDVCMIVEPGNLWQRIVAWILKIFPF